MKDIPGYEGLYAITKDGYVWSYRGSRFLKNLLTYQGYFSVTISVSGKRGDLRVHRAVAVTYLDNPENKPQINHKNGVRIDNRVENLEWCTPSENNLHAYRSSGRQTTKKQREARRENCLKLHKRIYA